MADSALRLRAPADPALAGTIRTFVASSGRYLDLDPELLEDLRLAANELFSAASGDDRAPVELVIDVESGEVIMTVVGVPDLDDSLDDLPRTRQDLLLALFPALRREGEAIVISATPDRS
jgi:hypothetical protein